MLLFLLLLFGSDHATGALPVEAFGITRGQEQLWRQVRGRALRAGYRRS